MYFCRCVVEETKASTNCTAAFLNGYGLEESDWRLWPRRLIGFGSYGLVYWGFLYNILVAIRALNMDKLQVCPSNAK